MDIHGSHGYPWNPWVSMESMDIHGIHGYPWIPWIFMESMESTDSMEGGAQQEGGAQHLRCVQVPNASWTAAGIRRS